MSFLQYTISLIPEFKGKKRLARLLFKNKIHNSREIIVRAKNNIQYILPNIIENIGFDIFVNGEYEHHTVAFISKRIPPNGTLVDVGANIGAICIPVSKKRKDLSIIALEASPKVYKYLGENINLNKVNIVSLNNAVTENNNEQVMIYSPDTLFGKGSQTAVYTNEPEYVNSISLDQLDKNFGHPGISFIKIDIEGYEYYAFKGGASLLAMDHAPDILFEFNFSSEDHAHGIVPGDAQRLLRSYGYNIYKINEDQSLVLQNEIIVKGSYLLFASKQKLT